MKLDTIVPWGRSFAEYRGMFDLNPADLKMKILGCGDGPASFNAEATAVGAEVVSADPIYAFTAEEIRRRINDAAPAVMKSLREHANNYNWDVVKSPAQLERLRRQAMDAFLRDYPAGKEAGRYVDASLPRLPFENGAFGLALCSHFLFLYSDRLDRAAHQAAARELVRVADEVRVYPLVTLDGRPSPHVGAVVNDLLEAGHQVAQLPVTTVFQKGATDMLVIRAGRR
jgi:hypothetical protein